MAKMTNEKEMYQIYWAFPCKEEEDKVKKTTVENKQNFNYIVYIKTLQADLQRKNSVISL